MARGYAPSPSSPEPDEIVSYWLKQIEAAQKARAKWYERVRKINERYLSEKELVEADPHTMNVLWSNVETIKPALYAKTPTAKVSRRYRDKDPVGRWGAIVLERSLGFGLDCYDFDYTARGCVEDYLLGGIGQAWVSYEPDIRDNKKVSWEYCKNKHLHYKDFLSGPARTWDEVPWVAQRAYLTKDEVKTRFKGKSGKLSFEEVKNAKGEADKNSEKKAAIWEIWSKSRGLVYFVSKNCPELLEEPQGPFLDLEGFFPCPRPLIATVTTDSLIPTPDFILYQNQADEIDRLTQRINLLTQALRVVGLYDSSLQSLRNLLDGSSSTNEMVPCDNWAVYAQAGGFKGVVEFFPLDAIVKALEQCFIARDNAKQVMYEITGISDIVRGASDPNETLGAQQIKTQWGGLRIRDRQKEVQRFARDLMRLNAEIIAEQFQLETLKTMSNAPLLMEADKQKLQQRQQLIAQAQQLAAQNPEAAQAIAQANPQIVRQLQPLSLDEMQALADPTWEEVYAFLRDQKLRSFRIDIETDSTINADEQEEKAARTEFVTAVTTMVQTWGPIIMQEPKIAPLFGELLLFATRSFRTADTLETAIEEMVETFSQRALLPPQPAQEDPKIGMERERLGMEKENFANEDKYRRDEMAAKNNHELQKMNMINGHEMQKQASDIEGQVKVAQAQRPQLADAAALQPLFDLIGQHMAGLTQNHIATQQQVAAQGQNGAQAVQQALEMLAQIAASPKNIAVHRDKNNRIVGGTATPMVVQGNA